MGAGGCQSLIAVSLVVARKAGVLLLRDDSLEEGDAALGCGLNFGGCGGGGNGGEGDQ